MIQAVVCLVAGVVVPFWPALLLGVISGVGFLFALSRPHQPRSSR
jgi:hypothetical protein